MILSFPVDAWLLLLVAVGLGLGLELLHYRARRGDPARRDRSSDSDGRGA